MTDEIAGTPAVSLPAASGVPAHAAADYVAALGALDDLRRDRTAKVETKGGGSYSYAYTDLAGVLGAVRPVLAEHHFAVTQPVETVDGYVRVSTVLVHCSGEAFPSPSLGMRQPDGAQALGSAITYLRRYSLLAALGLATEDDDGKAAAPAPKPRPTSRVARGPADEIRRRTAHAMALFADLGLGDRDDRLQVTSAILGRPVASWSETTPTEQNRVIAELIERQRETQDDPSAPWLRRDDDADGYPGGGAT